MASRDHDHSTTAKPRLTTAEILTKAADLIEPKGAWTQGTFWRDREGRQVCLEDALLGSASCMCMAGAIYVASGQRHPSHRLWELVDKVIPRPRDGSAAMPFFNDNPERKQAEVVAALRKAAALAREAEEPTDGAMKRQDGMADDGPGTN